MHWRFDGQELITVTAPPLLSNVNRKLSNLIIDDPLPTFKVKGHNP